VVSCWVSGGDVASDRPSLLIRRRETVESSAESRRRVPISGIDLSAATGIEIILGKPSITLSYPIRPIEEELNSISRKLPRNLVEQRDLLEIRPPGKGRRPQPIFLVCLNGHVFLLAYPETGREIAIGGFATVKEHVAKRMPVGWVGIIDRQNGRDLITSQRKT